ncbi:alpha/beta fold hydrolase [Burkholderia multivorans]|uniref:alpha/beta fold hydrolase n=1 Tax=Burkholderia multivorans TaxID=87883 RepID=UPI001C2102C0|nr:alpha/beta hydrolase [Burkholderia multivorans]MBU9221168.1 alpha/beta hydrolase [Burkholderia multivorans]MBU9415972.1 alpha/beta hydrolase [Burkholderia multivorans]
MPLPLVFLPAMPCDGRMYAHQLEGLADLVSPSVWVLSRPTFAESAQSLLASVNGPFVLAGTAYGGCLAMEVLASAPERVRGLWLMNCHPGVHPFPDGVRSTSRRLRTGELEAVIAEFAENAIPSGNAGAKAAFVQMAREAGADLFARQSDATLTRSDRWSTLAATTVPTLLIWGNADRFVPAEIGLRIAASMPHAQYESLDGCGHFPTLERPYTCTDIARRWLTRDVIGAVERGRAAR